MSISFLTRFAFLSVILVAASTSLAAQDAAVAELPARSGAAVATEYVIGAEDVIGIVFWREDEMSGDVTVRPDGKVSLPLIGDVVAAGLRPESLRDEIQKAAAAFITDPNVTVIVRIINSRKVFITGEVLMPGEYSLTGPQKARRESCPLPPIRRTRPTLHTRNDR